MCALALETHSMSSLRWAEAREVKTDNKWRHQTNNIVAEYCLHADSQEVPQDMTARAATLSL